MEVHKRNNLIIIGIATLIIGVLAYSVYYFFRKTKEQEAEMVEVVEMMNFEKKQVEKEFADLSVEFDGYTANIKNDSLVQKLQNEKMKVKQLLDELKVTKSTNAKRISELKAELAGVRRIMIQYVNQIDSLNSANKVLVHQNVEVTKKYHAVSETAAQLSKEKESLNQVVSRAAILEVTHFSFVPLNSKNKKVGWFTQMANMQFNYTITKNVTAQPGEKTMYLRITRPDDEVLCKNKNNLFQYENKKIVYSISKVFEYTGESIVDALYWKVEEIIPKGNYRAEFFADGNRIGSFSFTVEK